MKDRFGYDWSKFSGKPFWKLPHISRRVFFRHAAAAVSGYYLMPSRPMETIAKAGVSTIGTAKNCIFILLAGAPSHIDTFDLKEGSWTPATFAPTSYGTLRFPQGLMPTLAGHIGDMAFVRTVRAWATAHGIGQNWVQIGRNPVSGLAKIAPHIGSVVALEMSPSSTDKTMPPFLSLNASDGPGSGYFPPQYAPFYVSPNGSVLPNTRNSDGPDVFNRRNELKMEVDAELEAYPALGPATDEMAAFRANALQLMYNANVDSIFTLDTPTKSTYGNTSFGNACIVARNLIRANNGTRFVQITLGSWDHHVNIYSAGNLPGMSKTLDLGLGNLISDLKKDGTLDSTLIVALGEFGRTVGGLNTTSGRDHHVQQTAIFAGAKITGGRAIGSTDAAGANIVDPGWSGGREIKAEDIEATIYTALGIDWTTVRHDDPLGRGFEYVPTNEPLQFQPINELWGG